MLCQVPTAQLGQMITAVSEPPGQVLAAAIQGGQKGEVILALKKLRMLIKGGVSAADRDAGRGDAQVREPLDPKPLPKPLAQATART